MQHHNDEECAEDKHPCAPFLKWPGGKRWLAPTVARIAGTCHGTYFEPFLGGGAVFFYIRPARATLSDSNGRLIQVYRQVQHRVDDLIEELAELRPARWRFTEFREVRPRAHLARAIQFLYLNRTAFNGMYRVNQRGVFNVPYGCKPGTKVCEAQLLRKASTALASATLLHSSFQPCIDRAGRGDVVYCDPPYTVKHDNNGFIRYNESIFSWEDQERLAASCRAAVARGAKVIVSNAHHAAIRALYTGFHARLVHRQSRISGELKGRGSVSEYLFVSKS